MNEWSPDAGLIGSKSQSHLEICFFSSQQRNACPLKTQRLFLSIWLTFGTLMTWGLIHTVRYTHLWFCLHFSRCSFCVQTSWVYVVFTYLCSSFSKCVLCIFTCIIILLLQLLVKVSICVCVCVFVLCICAIMCLNCSSFNCISLGDFSDSLSSVGHYFAHLRSISVVSNPRLRLFQAFCRKRKCECSHSFKISQKPNSLSRAGAIWSLGDNCGNYHHRHRHRHRHRHQLQTALVRFLDELGPKRKHRI